MSGGYRRVRVKSQNKFATLESLDESTGINRGEKYRDIKVSAKKSQYIQKNI